jgi:hypothetical protein
LWLAGISSTEVFDKTDKKKPMGAFVSSINPLVGQAPERGASPLLYAAASPELTGMHMLFHDAYSQRVGALYSEGSLSGVNLYGLHMRICSLYCNRKMQLPHA